MKVDNKVGSSLPHNIDTAKTAKASNKQSLENLIAPKSNEGSSNVGGSSKVDVSDRAQMMQKAKEIASQSTVDEARVARLQKLIDEGKYKTDANAIADRLVDEHMSFND